MTAAEEFVLQLYQATRSRDLCSAGAGRCGDLRYVETDCAFEAFATKYFDPQGMLVAATVCSDGCGDVCPGACCVDYGFRPECEKEQEQDFCDQLTDLTCRDWCVNEPQGSSCHQGPPESVEDCHEDCLQGYRKEEEQSGCGDAWIRIKICQLDFECEDPSGECDWHEEVLDSCRANSYCQANCPTQDRQECIEQYLATGLCGTVKHGLSDTASMDNRTD
jgi:hypothetical protein